MSIQAGGIVNSNSCGIGNKLFQYCTLIAYCHENKLHLRGGANKRFDKYMKFDPKAISEIGGKGQIDNSLPQKQINSGDFDKDDNLKFKGNGNYRTSDFFQNANYLNKNFENIIKYVDYNEYDKFKPTIDNVNDDDIICFIRLGEILYTGENNPSSEGLHPNYYLNIFKQKNFRKIYIRVHPSDDSRIPKYLEFFNEYKNKIEILEKKDDKFDFHIVKQFKNIAISNSTFNWWSIFFLKDIENKNVYTPKYFGHKGYKKEKHGIHVKDLWNIRGVTIPIEHDFISMNK